MKGVRKMISRKEIIDTYKQAIKTYGEHAQKLMAIEEMSELTKEICKDFRWKLDREHLIEEMADVLIMLDQMLILYKTEQVICLVLLRLDQQKENCLNELKKLGVEYVDENA